MPSNYHYTNTFMRPLFSAILVLSSVIPIVQVVAQENYAGIIGIHNRILAKINNQTISVLDVRKHMDLFLQKQYPDIFENPYAMLQFYQNNWKPVLGQMIDQELMLAEAAEKEVKIPDGELREEIISRFGPKIVTSLDRVGLTYEDAKRMIEKEMIAQRMQWFQIQSRVHQKVQPAKIKQKYVEFCKNNPPQTILTYRVIHIRGVNELETKTVLNSLKNAIEIQKTSLYEAKKKIPFGEQSLLISDVYEVEESKLSEKVRPILSGLLPRQLSKPIPTSGMTEQPEYTFKVYLLENSKRIEPTPFERKYQELENQVFQEEFEKVSSEYMKKLRAKWHQTIVFENTDQFEPFYLRNSP